MEKTGTAAEAQDRQAPSCGKLRNRFLIVLLLLWAAGIHAWHFHHTEVAARDSIGFIRYALRLENEPWREVLPRIEQHPLYPLAIMAVSRPVRDYYYGGITPHGMVRSAQLVSALAGILLVVPMFYLGRELFNRRVGFWAAALFQVLPVAAHITADALSEAVFFFNFTLALVLAARALRRRSPVMFALCGLSCALAYLTRPEGAFVFAAILLVLVGGQFRKAWRWPWRRLAVCTSCLLASAALLAAPYMAAIGGVTVKPTPHKMYGSDTRTDTLPPPQGCTGLPLFAVWWNGAGSPPLQWGVWALGKELVHSFHYLFWLPTLLGIWCLRKQWGSVPGAWVVFWLCLPYTLVLCRMAMVVGYLSERHTLLLVLCGSFWAAAALTALADRLAVRRNQAIAATLLCLMTASILPWTLKPLHANRAGHRQAGLFLAVEAGPADVIVDPFCWAHYYAGRVFEEGRTPALAPGQQPVYWVVLEASANSHSRLPLMVLARELAQYSQTPAFRSLPPIRKHRAEEVVVYRVPALK